MCPVFIQDCPSTVSSEVLLKSRLQPHPVIIMLAEKLVGAETLDSCSGVDVVWLSQGWSRFRGVAITGLKQYNSGIADKRAYVRIVCMWRDCTSTLWLWLCRAMQQHLTSTDTIAAHCRQSLASKVTADELPALAMACYVVSVTASAANGRLVPYRCVPSRFLVLFLHAHTVTTITDSAGMCSEMSSCPHFKALLELYQ